MRLVVAALVVRDGLLLAAQRSYPAELAGRWEFPGGKVEAGEEPEQALVREVAEELGATVRVTGTLAGPSDGLWPVNENLTIQALWCELIDGEPHPHEHERLMWLGHDDWQRLDWLPGDVPIASAAAARLRRP